MGVDVCVYRMRIGLFYQMKHLNGYSKINNFSMRTVSLVLLIVISTSLLLLSCGDIEANPGPKYQDNIIGRRRSCSACGRCSMNDKEASYFRFPINRFVVLLFCYVGKLINIIRL